MLSTTIAVASLLLTPTASFVSRSAPFVRNGSSLRMSLDPSETALVFIEYQVKLDASGLRTHIFGTGTVQFCSKLTPFFGFYSVIFVSRMSLRARAESSISLSRNARRPLGPLRTLERSWMLRGRPDAKSFTVQ